MIRITLLQPHTHHACFYCAVIALEVILTLCTIIFMLYLHTFSLTYLPIKQSLVYSISLKLLCSE